METETPAGQAGAPDRLAGRGISVTYDARADLAAGAHPVQRVMRELGDLPPDGIYELVTPFLPAPLIDMAKAKGFSVWSEKRGDDEVRTYFGREGLPDGE